MGSYLDSLAAAHRRRLARMKDVAPTPERGAVKAGRATPTPGSAPRDDMANIVARLGVVEARLATLVHSLPLREAKASRPAPPRPQDLPQARPLVADVKCAVCRDYGVRLLDLEGLSRFPAIVRARQIAMYLSRQFTLDSYPEIARQFGDREHTTALHAYNKIKRLRATDAELDRRLAALETRIRAELRPFAES